MLPKGFPFHQFNLTTIKTLSWLCGLEVTHQTAMTKGPGLVPGLDTDFYVHINNLIVVWALHFFGSKTNI